MKGFKRKVEDPKGDINVTPLVDVVLVLLIIFMVVTPMLERGRAVALPVTDNPKKKPEIDEQITITVDAQGLIWLETTQVTDGELQSHLTDTFKRTPTIPVFVKGDSNARYAVVRRVMRVVNKSGFETVGVITKERKEGSARAE